MLSLHYWTHLRNPTSIPAVPPTRMAVCLWQLPNSASRVSDEPSQLPGDLSVSSSFPPHTLLAPPPLALAFWQPSLGSLAPVLPLWILSAHPSPDGRHNHRRRVLLSLFITYFQRGGLLAPASNSLGWGGGLYEPTLSVVLTGHFP